MPRCTRRCRKTPPSCTDPRQLPGAITCYLRQVSASAPASPPASPGHERALRSRSVGPAVVRSATGPDLPSYPPDSTGAPAPSPLLPLTAPDPGVLPGGTVCPPSSSPPEVGVAAGDLGSSLVDFCTVEVGASPALFHPIPPSGTASPPLDPLIAPSALLGPDPRDAGCSPGTVPLKGPSPQFLPHTQTRGLSPTVPLASFSAPLMPGPSSGVAGTDNLVAEAAGTDLPGALIRPSCTSPKPQRNMSASRISAGRPGAPTPQNPLTQPLEAPSLSAAPCGWDAGLDSELECSGVPAPVPATPDLSLLLSQMPTKGDFKILLLKSERPVGPK
ncbi:uncharacterized protein LOC130282688 isoform X1 [Hyla sarda]|uniref:uncharacterized protein LOC130282688 isoform X1 n=1 Tax=Hyla sarda TaxID=327740 RepID=UPI0024C30B19|nr:uncharacterized protein LOC130282688 isoform X1 [Hyla sarda]